MPDTLLQLRISPELYDRARLKTARLLATHDDAVEELTKEIKAATSEKQLEKLHDRWEALHERGRRVTIHNVVRVAIDVGLKEMDLEEALASIAEEGVPLGRPRRIAG